jgi:hypothetical protein
LIYIMVAVRKVDRKPKPDLEKVPEHAAVQYDTPLPYRKVEEPEPGVDVVVVDFGYGCEGDLNVGWSEAMIHLIQIKIS